MTTLLAMGLKGRFQALGLAQQVAALLSEVLRMKAITMEFINNSWHLINLHRREIKQHRTQGYQ